MTPFIMLLLFGVVAWALRYSRHLPWLQFSLYGTAIVALLVTAVRSADLRYPALFFSLLGVAFLRQGFRKLRKPIADSAES